MVITCHDICSTVDDMVRISTRVGEEEGAEINTGCKSSNIDFLDKVIFSTSRSGGGALG